MLDSKPEPITFEHWIIREWIGCEMVDDYEELSYSIAAWPKPSAPIHDHSTGYYMKCTLSKPPIPATMDEFIAIARTTPTEIQLAEMRGVMLSLKMKTDEVEKEGEAKEEGKK